MTEVWFEEKDDTKKKSYLKKKKELEDKIIRQAKKKVNKDLKKWKEEHDYTTPALTKIEPEYKELYKKRYAKKLARLKDKSSTNRLKEEDYDFISKFSRLNKDYYNDISKYGEYGSDKYKQLVQQQLKTDLGKIEKENVDAYAKLEHLISGYLQEWREIAPRSISEAVEVGRVCGKACFLDPNTGDYPICPRCGPNECYCTPVCSGLYNANVISSRRGDKHINAHARRLAHDIGCDWALLIEAYLEYKRHIH